MQFEEYYRQENFRERALQISSTGHLRGHSDSVSPSSEDIHSILERWEQGLGLEDLRSLLSPVADAYLETLISCARLATRQRFGRVIQFYTPLYLSNHCHSTCTYCGFSRPNSIQRLTLSPKDALHEARLVYESGIRHILLLTGEDYKETPLGYLEDIIGQLSTDFASVSIEVYPLETEDYRRLRRAGLAGVAVYQETYDPRRYAQVHLGGMKKRMAYRLNCPDRIGAAQVRHLAIGALLGLSDPATEVFFVGMHARYLMRNYWQTEVSISLPRLRPAVGLEAPPTLSDRTYIRYLCALRLFLPQAGLNLSTREAPHLRDLLTDICITHISAGSKTEPGGYSGKESTEQFQTYDNRSVAELSRSLVQRGQEPVLVDWSPVLK